MNVSQTNNFQEPLVEKGRHKDDLQTTFSDRSNRLSRFSIKENINKEGNEDGTTQMVERSSIEHKMSNAKQLSMEDLTSSPKIRTSKMKQKEEKGLNIEKLEMVDQQPGTYIQQLNGDHSNIKSADLNQILQNKQATAFQKHQQLTGSSVDGIILKDVAQFGNHETQSRMKSTVRVVDDTLGLGQGIYSSPMSNADFKNPYAFLIGEEHVDGGVKSPSYLSRFGQSEPGSKDGIRIDFKVSDDIGKHLFPQLNLMRETDSFMPGPANAEENTKLKEKELEKMRLLKEKSKTMLEIQAEKEFRRSPPKEEQEAEKPTVEKIAQAKYPSQKTIGQTMNMVMNQPIEVMRRYNSKKKVWVKPKVDAVIKQTKFHQLNITATKEQLEQREKERKEKQDKELEQRDQSQMQKKGNITELNIDLSQAVSQAKRGYHLTFLPPQQYLAGSQNSTHPVNQFSDEGGFISRENSVGQIRTNQHTTQHDQFILQGHNTSKLYHSQFKRDHQQSEGSPHDNIPPPSLTNKPQIVHGEMKLTGDGVNSMSMTVQARQTQELASVNIGQSHKIEGGFDTLQSKHMSVEHDGSLQKKDSGNIIQIGGDAIPIMKNNSESRNQVPAHDATSNSLNNLQSTGRIAHPIFGVQHTVSSGMPTFLYQKQNHKAPNPQLLQKHQQQIPEQRHQTNQQERPRDPIFIEGSVPEKNDEGSVTHPGEKHHKVLTPQLVTSTNFNAMNSGSKVKTLKQSQRTHKSQSSNDEGPIGNSQNFNLTIEKPKEDGENLKNVGQYPSVHHSMPMIDLILKNDKSRKLQNIIIDERSQKPPNDTALQRQSDDTKQVIPLLQQTLGQESSQMNEFRNQAEVSGEDKSYIPVKVESRFSNINKKTNLNNSSIREDSSFQNYNRAHMGESDKKKIKLHPNNDLLQQINETHTNISFTREPNSMYSTIDARLREEPSMDSSNFLVHLYENSTVEEILQKYPHLQTNILKKMKNAKFVPKPQLEKIKKRLFEVTSKNPAPIPKIQLCIANNEQEHSKINSAKGLKYYEPRWIKKRSTTVGKSPHSLYDARYNIFAESKVQNEIIGEVGSFIEQEVEAEFSQQRALPQNQVYNDKQLYAIVMIKHFEMTLMQNEQIRQKGLMKDPRMYNCLGLQDGLKKHKSLVQLKLEKAQNTLPQDPTSSKTKPMSPIKSAIIQKQMESKAVENFLQNEKIIDAVRNQNPNSPTTVAAGAASTLKLAYSPKSVEAKFEPMSEEKHNSTRSKVKIITNAHSRFEEDRRLESGQKMIDIKLPEIGKKALPYLDNTSNTYYADDTNQAAGQTGGGSRAYTLVNGPVQAGTALQRVSSPSFSPDVPNPPQHTISRKSLEKLSPGGSPRSIETKPEDYNLLQEQKISFCFQNIETGGSPKGLSPRFSQIDLRKQLSPKAMDPTTMQMLQQKNRQIRDRNKTSIFRTQQQNVLTLHQRLAQRNQQHHSTFARPQRSATIAQSPSQIRAQAEKQVMQSKAMIFSQRRRKAGSLVSNRVPEEVLNYAQSNLQRSKMNSNLNQLDPAYQLMIISPMTRKEQINTNYIHVPTTTSLAQQQMNQTSVGVGTNINQSNYHQSGSGHSVTGSALHNGRHQSRLVDHPEPLNTSLYHDGNPSGLQRKTSSGLNEDMSKRSFGLNRDSSNKKVSVNVQTQSVFSIHQPANRLIPGPDKKNNLQSIEAGGIGFISKMSRERETNNRASEFINYVQIRGGEPHAVQSDGMSNHKLYAEPAIQPGAMQNSSGVKIISHRGKQTLNVIPTHHNATLSSNELTNSGHKRHEVTMDGRRNIQLEGNQYTTIENRQTNSDNGSQHSPKTHVTNHSHLMGGMNQITS